MKKATAIIVFVYILLPVFICLGCGIGIVAYITNCFKYWKDQKVGLENGRSADYAINDDGQGEGQDMELSGSIGEIRRMQVLQSDSANEDRVKDII